MNARSDLIVAGIDPGKTGALAILYPDAVTFLDVPRIELRGKDKPAWLDWYTGWSNALEFACVDLIVIEDVSARPGQGVTSMFTFGRSLGYAHAIAAGVRPRPRIEFVTPAVWKGKLGLLNSGKGASREKCRSIYPSTAHYLQRVKDDGRAEAALIAHYGKTFLQGPQ
jgi:crossover junction endodeoxyribonuclease RuvC